MTKISATRIANEMLNFFWFLVYGFKDIFSDIRKTAIFCFCIITAVSVSVSVWSLNFRLKEPVITYNLIPEDENAVACVRDDREELIYNNDIYIAENKVHLLFGLPYDYKYDAVISVKSQGTVFAKSKRITAGKKIEELNIDINFDDMYVLQNGSAELIIDFYDRNTGEMLDRRLVIDVFMWAEETQEL